jgi:hypothetical protein
MLWGCGCTQHGKIATQDGFPTSNHSISLFFRKYLNFVKIGNFGDDTLLFVETHQFYLYD